MKISEEGKKYLTQMMSDSGVNTLRFYAIPGCCGLSVGVELAPIEETDRVEIVDGFEVAIHQDIDNQLTNVTIHAEEEDGEVGLVLMGYSVKTC